jgi:hypothetical protein
MNEIRDNMNQEVIPVGAVEIGEDGNIFYTANVLRRKFREKYPEGRIFVGVPKRVNPDPAAVDEYITECKVYAKATDAPEAFLANAFAKKKSDEKIDGYAWSQTAAVVAALGNAGITNPVISPADKFNIMQAKENDIEAAEEAQTADVVSTSEPVKAEEPAEEPTEKPAEEPAEVANVDSDIDEEMAKINETISQQLFAEDVKLEANVAPAVVETVNEEASAESDTERTEGNETVMSEDDISELQESTTEEINDEVSSAAEKDAPEEMVTSDVVEENTKEETTESGVETETADDAKDAESEETVEAPAVENEAKIEEKPVKEVQQLSSDTSPYVIKKYMDETIKKAYNELTSVPEMLANENTFSEAVEICQAAIQAAANIKATIMPGRSYHRITQAEKLLQKKLEETIPLIGEEHLHLNVAGTSLISEAPSHVDESEEVPKETEPTVHKNSSNAIPSIDDTSITDEEKIKEYEKIIIRTSISDTAEDSGMTIKEMFERVKNGDRKAIRVLNWYKQSKPGEEKRKFWKDVILYLISHGYGE